MSIDRRWQRWGTAETALAADASLSGPEVARLTGRTVAAVWQKRCRMGAATGWRNADGQEPAGHGTYQRYRKGRCRCADCREANRAYHARYMARVRRNELEGPGPQGAGPIS